MKTFKEYINESEWKVADEFIGRVEKSFKKEFPNGFFRGYAKLGLGEPHISIVFGLIEEQKDTSNSIRQNDPMYHSVMIHSNGDFEADNLELSSLQGGLNTNPEEGSYMAMKNVKTGLRNMKKGSLAKMEKSLDSFFKKLKKIVKDNKENIYGYDKIDKKYFKGM